MSCNNINGLILSDLCRDGYGGAAKVYIGVFSGTFSTAWTLSGTYSNIITGWGGATPSLETFEQYDEVINFTAPWEGSDTNSFWRPTISFTLPRFGDDSNGQSVQLARGAWFVAVETNYGEVFMLNSSKPMRVTEGASGTGQAANDPSGTNLTLSATSRDLPYRIDPSILQAAIA